ncbi:MAG: NAD-dependent malic enzyme [Phycisphaerales bacterium]|nr:NAD-dependent malic enzyme [Phycisphaerales bacterium]
MPSPTETGHELLRDPARNKGTAFTEAERVALGLTGLLPAAIETLEERIARIHWQLDACATDLARYVLLAQLMDTDETLFHAVLASAPEKMLPIIYTPTVGAACEEFGHLLRRARGLFIPITLKGRIKEILGNWRQPDVRFIVVTDGSRILGLGDLGANGMGIPIGKLACYSGAAGVPADKTLPITLDVGTDRDELLEGPMYIGLRQKRPAEDEYYEFLEEFITAVEETWPGCCVQFEDFNIHHAEPLLEKYRNRLCCFNDDIQGTAGVAVGGLYTACRAKGETIGQQRVLFLGAGSAGCGIASLIEKAMVDDGCTEEDAASRVALFNRSGLLTKDRDDLSDFQMAVAIDHEPASDFAQFITSFKPTAIIGVCTVGGAFNEDVLKAMCAVNDRPIIFPYSNPTSHSECTAEEAYAASDGTCLFASGSPMPPLEHEGHTINPAQGNNVYIFPAMGLAIYATEAKHVSDEMFLRAGQALSHTLTEEELALGLLYPERSRLRESSLHVAIEVAKQIFAEGATDMDEPDDIAAHVAQCMWQPQYEPAI